MEMKHENAQSRKADLILHPVRMRILVAISGGRMTAQQLVHTFPDVPQTTLYRHLNYLTKHGVLAVVEEHQVRGTVERVYALAPEMATLTPADVAGATGEDHLNYFSIFATSLISDFARYAQSQANIDVVADSVLYTKLTVHMSNSERREFQEAAQALILPLLARQPDANRRAYLFSTIFFPANDIKVTAETETQE
jgi:DNA-binding HxlR family transcriptional regulator